MKRGNQSQSGYYCEHCDKFLAYSTYKKHRKLFFTATGKVIESIANAEQQGSYACIASAR